MALIFDRNLCLFYVSLSQFDIFLLMADLIASHDKLHFVHGINFIYRFNNINII